MNLNIAQFLDFKMFCGSVEKLASNILASLEQSTNSNLLYLSCLNPHSVVVSRSRSEFRDALLKANWLIPDGIGVVLGLRVLGVSVEQRITGFDIFHELSRQMNVIGGRRVFFLGSTDATLKKIIQNYKRDFPNIEIVGAFSPPFQSQFNHSITKDICNRVNASDADLVWVGLSSPKQDLWMKDNIDMINAKVALGIGAVFDFYAGNISRGPNLAQKLGLEWLFRLFQEPRRLWRRTLVSAPLYLVIIIKEYLMKRSCTD